MDGGAATGGAAAGGTAAAKAGPGGASKPEGAAARRRAGVPPPEAFDHVKRLPPPPQPWLEPPPAVPRMQVVEGNKKRSGQAKAGKQVASPPGGKTAKGKAVKGRGQAVKGQAATTANGPRGKAARPAPPAGGAPAPGAPTAAVAGIKLPQRPVNPARQRRRRQLAAVMAMVIIIALGVWFSFTVLFKIQRYDVKGESPYSGDEIIAAFGHAVGDNLYGFSVSAAQARIVEALPYIDSVDILRRPPSTVVLRVHMAQEAYYLPLGEEYVILSSGRKVLRQTPEEPQGLMRIDGLHYLAVQPGQPLRVDANAVQVASAEQEAAASIEAATPPQRQGNLPPPLPTPEEARSAAAEEAARRAEEEAKNGGEDGDDATGNNAEGEGAGSGAEGEPDVSQEPEAEPEPEAPPDPATAQESLEVLDALLAALAETGLGDIDWVNVGDPLDISFSWQQRIIVRLGPRTGLDEKLTAVTVVLTNPSQGLLPEDRGTLDARYYLATLQLPFDPEKLTL